jgi:hypothetical protein
VGNVRGTSEWVSYRCGWAVGDVFGRWRGLKLSYEVMNCADDHHGFALNGSFLRERWTRDALPILQPLWYRFHCDASLRYICSDLGNACHVLADDVGCLLVELAREIALLCNMH